MLTAYVPPRNRQLEIRLIQALVREKFDKQANAAAASETDTATFSRMLTGQAPLDLNRIGLWPWDAKREFLVRLQELWLREYLDDQEKSA